MLSLIQIEYPKKLVRLWTKVKWHEVVTVSDSNRTDLSTKNIKKFAD